MDDSLTRLRAAREQLAADLESAATKVAELGHPALARPLGAEGHEARVQKFQVAVVGEFSSGKSTILNALLGEKLLPAKMAPCTAEVLEIQYALEPRLTVSRGDRDEVLSVDKLADISVLHARDKEEIARERASSTITRILLEVPNPPCDAGVALLDTPGLNEAEARTQITAARLPLADASVLLLRATDLLSKTEREFIESEARKDPVDRRWLENAFVVVTFADVATQDEDDALAELRLRLDTFLDGVLPPHGVARGRRFFVDARSALLLRTGSSGSTDGVEFERFERELRDFLVHKRGSIELESRKLSAETVLRRALGGLVSERDALEAEAGSLQEKVERTRSTVARERERVGRLVEGLRSRGGRLSRDLSTDFRMQARGWLEGGLEEYLLSEEYPDTVIRANPACEWYTERGLQWFQDNLQHWSNTVPPARLAELLEDFERSYSDDLELLRKNLSEAAKEMGFDDFGVDAPDDTPLAWLSRSAAGWLAGGPLGAAVGNLMGWQGVAANAAINLGLGIAALVVGLSIPVLGWVVIAAAVAGAQIFLGQSGIKKRLAKKVAGGLAEQLQKQVDESIPQVEAQAQEAVGDIATEIGKAAEGLISVLEETANAAADAAAASAEVRTERLRSIAKTRTLLQETLTRVASVEV